MPSADGIATVVLVAGEQISLASQSSSIYSKCSIEKRVFLAYRTNAFLPVNCSESIQRTISTFFSPRPVRVARSSLLAWRRALGPQSLRSAWGFLHCSCPDYVVEVPGHSSKLPVCKPFIGNRQSRLFCVRSYTRISKLKAVRGWERFERFGCHSYQEITVRAPCCPRW